MSVRARPGQRRNDRTPNGGGNGLHRGKVAFRGDGKAGLDHVHAQAVELVRQTQLFLHVHAASRATARRRASVVSNTVIRARSMRK